VPSVLRCFDAAVVLVVVEVVWLFLFDFRFFFLFFLSSSLVFFLWWPGTYCIRFLPRCHPWRSIIRCLEFVSIDVSFFSLVSHVPVVVPRKLLSFLLFHPVVVPFFFARCRRLALTACFRRPFGMIVTLERIIVSVVYLICSWELFAIAMALVCLLMSSCVAFSYRYSVRFASSFFRTLVATPRTNGSHRMMIFHCFIRCRIISDTIKTLNRYAVAKPNTRQILVVYLY